MRALLLVLLGCGGGAPEAAPDPPAAQTAPAAPAPPEAEPCRGVAPASAQGELRLVPVRGKGVRAAAAVDAAESAARFWRLQGLGVEVAPPRASPIAHALAGTDESLAFHLGRGVGTEAEVTAQVVGAPMVAAARSLGQGAPAGTVFVLAVERIVAPDSPARNWGLTVHGMTLGADSGGRDAVLLRALRLPEDSAPIVFLDVGTPRRPGDVWTTPAHEVGHALGLLHRPGGEAVLMRPGVDGQRCWPGISAEEARQVSARLVGSAPELSGEHAPQAEGREPGSTRQGDVGAGEAGEAPR